MATRMPEESGRSSAKVRLGNPGLAPLCSGWRTQSCSTRVICHRLQSEHVVDTSRTARTVVLWGHSCPFGQHWTIWRHLISTGVGVAYQHLVCGGQGCWSTPYNAQDRSRQND